MSVAPARSGREFPSGSLRSGRAPTALLYSPAAAHFGSRADSSVSLVLDPEGSPKGPPDLAHRRFRRSWFSASWLVALAWRVGVKGIGELEPPGNRWSWRGVGSGGGASRPRCSPLVGGSPPPTVFASWSVVSWPMAGVRQTVLDVICGFDRGFSPRSRSGRRAVASAAARPVPMPDSRSSRRLRRGPTVSDGGVELGDHRRVRARRGQLRQVWLRHSEPGLRLAVAWSRNTSVAR